MSVRMRVRVRDKGRARVKDRVRAKVWDRVINLSLMASEYRTQACLGVGKG